MNTKDNQEAELLRLDELLKIKEACEKALAPIGNMSDAPVLNALKKGMEFNNAMWPQQILNLVNEVLELRATLTTPQVNEEVASGEAVCSICNNSGYYCIGYSGLECDGNAPMLERCDCEIGQPTPSPSNVLVEALREITYSHDGYARKKAEQALATYSSTDSVSISPSEYEAMKADVERMNYICDDKNIYWIHIQTEPSGLDLFHSGRAPELREAIDTARKSS